MNPPKQKLPDKVTLAELDEACSLRSDNEFKYPGSNDSTPMYLGGNHHNGS